MFLYTHITNNIMNLLLKLLLIFTPQLINTTKQQYKPITYGNGPRGQNKKGRHNRKTSNIWKRADKHSYKFNKKLELPRRMCRRLMLRKCGCNIRQYI